MLLETLAFRGSIELLVAFCSLILLQEESFVTFVGVIDVGVVISAVGDVLNVAESSSLILFDSPSRLASSGTSMEENGNCK